MNREARRKAGLVSVEGVLVERDALHIAERIHEYDSNLTLQYLEQADNLREPPFRVVERCRDGLERVAFTAWRLDEDLLRRIWAADTQVQDIDALVTGKNITAKCNQQRRYEEKKAEQNEMVETILKSPKTRYSVKVEQPDGNKKKVVFE